MESLNGYAKNYYSQYGEDGILEEIFLRLKKHIDLDGWCSEFGAWDGVFLSNTCHLIKKLSYKAVLIEGDSSRIELLNKNFPSDDVIKINRFVSFEGSNSLDNIYSETTIPQNFDFLSIDVDGVDYHIFESLHKFKPKVICVEFNQSIPNAVDYVQSKDMEVRHGNSAKALTRLAHQKGYSLAGSTRCNLFFVDNSLFKFILDEEPLLEDINQGGNSETYIFSGYDGSILSNNDYIRLGWHESVPVSVSENFQFLPKFIRKFKPDYNFLQMLFYIIYMVLYSPRNFKYNMKKDKVMAIILIKVKIKKLLGMKINYE